MKKILPLILLVTLVAGTVVAVVVINSELTRINDASAFRPGEGRVEFTVSSADIRPNAAGGMQETILDLAKRQATQEIQNQSPAEVVAYIPGGEYFIDQPLEITTADTSNVSKLIIMGVPGEDVTLTGARRIRGWENTGGNIWEIADDGLVDSNGQVRQLFADGERLFQSFYVGSSARYLTVSQAPTDYQTITFTEQVPSLGNNAEYVNFTYWTSTIIPIESRVSANSIRLAYKHNYAGSVDPNYWQVIKPGMKGYINNIRLESSTANNVWEHDRTNGKIRIRLAQGRNPNEVDVRVPTTDQAVIIKGASNVEIKGINFEYFGGWKIPGVNVVAEYNPDSNSDEVRQIYQGKQGGTFSKQGWFPPYNGMMPGIVSIEGSTGVIIANNSFKNLGGVGLTVRGSDLPDYDIPAVANRRVSSDIEVSFNRFEDIGSNCIAIGDSYSAGHSAIPEENLPAAPIFEPNDPVSNDIEVRHNAIQECGQIEWGSVGIWQAHSRDVLISHNTLTNLPYTGISSGFIFGAIETAQRNIDIVNNRITNVMRITMDGGGIYTLGNSPESEITGNYIDGVATSRIVPIEGIAQGAPAVGLYFDNSTRGRIINNNVVLNVESDDNYIFWQPVGDGSGPEYNEYNEAANWLNRTGYSAVIPNNSGVQGIVGPEGLPKAGFEPRGFIVTPDSAKGTINLTAYGGLTTNPDMYFYSGLTEFGTIAGSANPTTNQAIDYYDFVKYSYLNGQSALVGINSDSPVLSGNSGFVEIYGFEAPYNEVTWEVITDLPVGEYQYDVFDFDDGNGKSIVAMRTDASSGKLEVYFLGEQTQYKQSYPPITLPLNSNGNYAFQIYDFGLTSGDDLVIFQDVGNGVKVSLFAQLDSTFEGRSIRGAYAEPYWDTTLPEIGVDTHHLEVIEVEAGSADLLVIDYRDQFPTRVNAKVYSQQSGWTELSWKRDLEIKATKR